MKPLTHFIDIQDHSAEWFEHVLDVGHELRSWREQGKWTATMRNKSLAMLFEKPSLRTRVSFQQAMYEMGGHAMSLLNSEFGIGERESAADIARVLSGMVQGIVMRVFEHRKLREMAEHAEVPVINALSDDSHPCQALADIMTLQDEFGMDLKGRTLAFIGDGNNVAISLAELCAKMNVHFVLAAPRDHSLDERWMNLVQSDHPDVELQITTDPYEAVATADAIYTDTFVSMGQESEKEQRLAALGRYQVNEHLLEGAPEHAIVLHCLPAYRGVEITDEALESSRSRVFPQAHNRLHAQKGLLAVLMGGA